MDDFLLNTNKKIAVIGDLMLDRYWYGDTTRISPEAPVPIVKMSNIKENAGGAANVATNISTLNINCSLFGIIGGDEAGNKLKNILLKNKVNCYFVENKNFSTITKLRILSQHQQLIRVDFENPYNRDDINKATELLKNNINDFNIIVCSDYNKGCLTNIQDIIKIATTKKIPVLVDPKGNNFFKYQGAFLLTPNMKEFQDIVGEVKTDKEIQEKALNLIKKLNLKALLITRSEKGMSLIIQNKKMLNIPTRAKEVFDVTGAGDTVISVLASCLANNISLEKSCEIANIAAGIVVGKLGAASLSKSELLSAINIDI